MTYRRPGREEFPGLSKKSKDVILAYRMAHKAHAMGRAWSDLYRRWLHDVPDKERAELEDILRKERARLANHKDQDQRD